MGDNKDKPATATKRGWSTATMLDRILTLLVEEFQAAASKDLLLVEPELAKDINATDIIKDLKDQVIHETMDERVRAR